MSLRQLNRVILSIFLIAAVSSDARGAFDIETSGSVYPSHAADGDWRVASTSTGEDSAMYVGLSSGGAVDVTNGATFTTPKRVWMGYSYGATTAINVTGAAWIAEDHVGLGNATAAEATINITQSTWTVDDSCYIGASTNATGEVNLYNQAVWTSKDYVHVGHHGVGEVNIDPNASWISQEAVNVGFFADSSGTVTLDGGDWTSQARLEVGHLALFGEFSEGAVNVNADSTLTCNGLLDVTPGGEVILDGGLLHLGGGGTFDGALSAAVGGGTVRLEVGSAEPDIDLCSLGSGVNFAGCTLEVVFDPAFTPSTSDSFNLFDPIDSVDLTEILTASSAISTPENWELDLATGVLSSISQGPDGDADNDLDVDTDDLAIFKAQFGGPFPGGANDPDFDDDGFVTLADFAIMRSNWDAGAEGSLGAPNFTPAPEPATIGILLVGGLAVLRRKQRR